MEELIRNLYNLSLEPALAAWAKSKGLVLGDPLGRKPLHVVLKDRKFEEELRGAIRNAAEADRPIIEAALKGALILAGLKPSRESDKLLRTISGDVASIAPYVQRWIPDIWDQMHGSRGSIASLTSAIADTHRHSLKPEQAYRLADEVFRELYDGPDPGATRGFSAREMGYIYRELAKRGMMPLEADAKKIAETLRDVAGPLSALQDAVGRTQKAPLRHVFPAFDKLRNHMNRFRRSYRELEQDIRRGSQMQRFIPTIFRSDRSGVDPWTAREHDLQLRANAEQSAAGNLIGATARLAENVGFAEGSPAAEMWRQVLSGGGLKDYQSWLTTLENSGIPRSIASIVSSQVEANRGYLTPELIQSIRNQQFDAEVAPVIEKSAPEYRNLVADYPLRVGHVEEVARRFGYKNTGHMEQLLTDPHKRYTEAFQAASNEADLATALSRRATPKPLARTVDALSELTPDTDLGEFSSKVLGLINPRELERLVPRPGMIKQFSSGSAMPPKGDVVILLRKAKRHSDRKDYRRKHAILRKLLRQRPGEFIIDSEDGNIVGLTHVRSGFRIHVPRYVLPDEFRRHSVLRYEGSNLAG